MRRPIFHKYRGEILPFLCSFFFWNSLFFSPFSFWDFLVFLTVFPFFSRDSRGSAGIKNPCFFGGFPCLFPKNKGKEGQGPSWKIGPFRGKLGPFQSRSGPIQGRSGPIFLRAPQPCTGEEQKLPRKGPFWPNWRLSGRGPRLLSPRLDFPEKGLFLFFRAPVEEPHP